MYHPRFKKRKILSLTIGVTTLLHIFLLNSLQGMKMDHIKINQNNMQSQLLSDSESRPAKIKERRDTELAKVFMNIPEMNPFDRSFHTMPTTPEELPEDLLFREYSSLMAETQENFLDPHDIPGALAKEMQSERFMGSSSDARFGGIASAEHKNNGSEGPKIGIPDSFTFDDEQFENLFSGSGFASGKKLPAGGKSTHVACSDDFNIELEYTDRSDDNEYFFRVILNPKPGVAFHKIRQNFIFLIDRSHSITKARFELTKTAVLNAVSRLSPDDTFNILFFHKSITKLSPDNLPVTIENILTAQEFLDEQNHGGMFAGTELYTSLGSIIPATVAENEVNTAILLSDGDTYLMPAKQRIAINNWTNENKGKVSLYCVAAGNNNNFSLLDVISVFNKGHLYVAKTNHDLVKTMKELMTDLCYPVAKELVTTAVPSQGNASIELGKTNSLDDFYLFFQGKYYEKSVDIKQHVSFDKGTKIEDNDIERNWALQSAYSYYEKYLKSGDNNYLEMAKQVLEDYKIPVAFN